MNSICVQRVWISMITTTIQPTGATSPPWEEPGWPLSKDLEECVLKTTGSPLLHLSPANGNRTPSGSISEAPRLKINVNTTSLSIENLSAKEVSLLLYNQEYSLDGHKKTEIQLKHDFNEQ